MTLKFSRLILCILSLLPHVHGVGLYDPALAFYVDEHELGDIMQPVDIDKGTSRNVTFGSYSYFVSMFSTNAGSDITRDGYVIGIAPICIAFNYPERFDEVFSMYSNDVTHLWLGHRQASLYDLGLFPTKASSLSFSTSPWRIALPNPNTPTGVAMDLSLKGSSPSDFKDSNIIRNNTLYPKVYWFDTDEALLEYIAQTPYSIGFAKFSHAAARRIPCMNMRVRRSGATDQIFSPRLHATDVEQFSVDLTKGSVAVGLPNATVYPLVGTITFQFSPKYVCER
eukprot:PhF_6_TR31502/c0_g1_i1/m.46377